MKIFNPATEELIQEMAEDDKLSVEKKYEDLHAAQASWRRVPLKERITILQRFSELLEENLEQNAFILTQEVGKPLQQSRNEIKGGIARIEWLTGNAEK
jgi:acyl-CoA reductase-like NAD-dependent aldehyde dehydrogenase